MRIRRLYIKLARLWYKLVTLKSSPRKIALGFALGIFLSFTPSFGFQTVLAIGLAALLRVNPISAAVGVYLTNPFTVVPIYAVCHEFGAFILGTPPVHEVPAADVQSGWWLVNLTKAGSRWMAIEFVGALFLGTVSATVAYFVMLGTVVKFRAARTDLRLKKMSRRIAEGEEGEEEQASGAPPPPS